VGYSLYLKESIKFNILSSPVRLNCEDLSIKFAFNKFMKVKKGKKGGIKISLKKVYPSKLAIIIDEVT
jgi:hypothetical protein